MSNEPTTYHLLVTLPNTYGEHADHLVSDTEEFLRNNMEIRDADVVHLTPETVPDRYVEAWRYDEARQAIDVLKREARHDYDRDTAHLVRLKGQLDAAKVDRGEIHDLVHRLDRVIEDYVGQGDTEDVVAPLKDISTDLLEVARRKPQEARR